MELINAKICSMDAYDYENGYIVVADGKIQSIGSMEDYIPSGTAVYDLNGRTVLPGYVDAHSHLGVFNDGLGFEGEDGNEDTDPSTPQLQTIDAINPFDKSFEDAVAGGITTAVVAPGSANPVAGQICAIKTKGICVDEMVFKNPLAIKFALGENPKMTYNEKSQAPVTRMGVASEIRTQLHKAKRYMEDCQRAQEDEDCDLPEYDEKCEALLPLLKSQIRGHFHAHRADDIFTAIRIAKEFDIGCVIVHGSEGHLIAQSLADRNVEVICGPMLNTRSKPELANVTNATPGVLSACGVRVAISTDFPEVSADSLALSTLICVKSGMDYERALRAITIDAAEICGISDRVGSIAPGKDADLLIFDEDPLGVCVRPAGVIIDGHQVIWKL